MSNVREKLWIWGHEAGSHDGQGLNGLKGSSRMTPAEGAFYLGVPNLLMVLTMLRKRMKSSGWLKSSPISRA